MIMAKQYARARGEFEKTFNALPEAEQDEGRRVIRKMQAVLDARKQALAQEQEKLRLARASIAAEQDMQQAEPPRKKTLAELEAAWDQFVSSVNSLDSTSSTPRIS